MSAQIARFENSFEFTDEMVLTLIQSGVIPNGTPKSQISVFAQVCREKGLSAFSKEIYLLEYAGKYSRIVGIDGFRKIAARTGQLAGCDDVKFNIKGNGEYMTASELKEKNEIPKTATVTVYRLVGGQRVPFTHTAVFSEFTTGKQKWQTMPFQMIAKVAEAFALRKGFSDELSGLSVDEEKGALTDDTVQISNTQIKIKADLTPNSEVWANAKKGIKDSMKKGITFTIEDIRKRYNITDEHFKLLME